MEFSSLLYAFFNIAEGFVWIGIACYLVIHRKRFKPEKRFWVLLAAPAFIAFAISDFLEAPLYATHIPAWLWAIKLVSGFLIFLSRVVYLGRGQKRAVTETVLLGFMLLGVALYFMFLF
jgi:hypothetical protein